MSCYSWDGNWLQKSAQDDLRDESPNKKRPQSNNSLRKLVAVGRLKRFYRRLSHCALASTGLSLRVFYQPTDERFHVDLVETKRLDFLWFISHQRQVPPAHVAAMLVVVFGELGNEVIQVPAPEQDELRQALVFDGANELFTVSVRVGTSHGKFVSPNFSQRMINETSEFA